jgi:hypothetical protein
MYACVIHTVIWRLTIVHIIGILEDDKQQQPVFALTSKRNSPNDELCQEILQKQYGLVLNKNLNLMNQTSFLSSKMLEKLT